MMNLERWKKLMSDFQFDDNESTWQELNEAYSEKHRHYHNCEHINACLKHFDTVKPLINENSKEIELAIWFHDAIYLTRKSGNELKSAEWAKGFLESNAAPKDMIDRVHRLIMATLHNATPECKNEAILVDIDLSILGSDSHVYENYSEAIRKEYRWVPYFLYQQKRKQVLQSFLNKEKIYNFPIFYEKWESQARKNLKRELEHL